MDEPCLEGGLCEGLYRKLLSVKITVAAQKKVKPTRIVRQMPVIYWYLLELC